MLAARVAELPEYVETDRKHEAGGEDAESVSWWLRATCDEAHGKLGQVVHVAIDRAEADREPPREVLGLQAAPAENKRDIPSRRSRRFTFSGSS